MPMSQDGNRDETRQILLAQTRPCKKNANPCPFPSPCTGPAFCPSPKPVGIFEPTGNPFLLAVTFSKKNSSILQQ